MLRKKYPDMERPYKIPGGMAMAGFAAIVTTIVFILSFIPASPFYAGALSIRMLIIWMVIGIVLYLASAGQRKGLTEQELEDGVFGERMGG